MTVNPTADDLWAFSLAFYGQADVPALCLDLQDRHGADVNVVLALLFAGTRGMKLDAAAVAALDAAVRDWRETVVVPLRAVRRRLKDELGEAPQALRTTVKGAELTAERLEQRALAAKLGADMPGMPVPLEAAQAAAAANLALYLAPRDAADKAEPFVAALVAPVRNIVVSHG